MRPLISPFITIAVVFAPLAARTAEPESLPPAVLPPNVAQPVQAPEAPGFEPRLVLDDGRTAFTPPSPDHVRFQIHGEYQVRVTHKTDLPLLPPPGDPTADSLGQNTAVRHWLRSTPRFDYRDTVSVIGQLDFPHGFFLGGRTGYVTSADDPMDEHHPLRIDPRWLFVQVMTPIGLIRVGQQGSHWGTGILANDGNHPRLFGDYRGGSIAERVLFATRPFGEDSPLAVIAAGDLVYRDIQAELTEGDHAFQGLLAVLLGDHHNEVGVQAALRRQRHDDEGVDEFTPFTEELDVAVFDVFGRFATRAPGGSSYLFGEAEAAYITGSTNYVRTPELGAREQDEQVRSWGGMAKLGVVHEAADGKDRWGDLVIAVEWGYASGDADPNDGEQHRFNFEPSHTVGLVLFNHVLGWMTARAVDNASDPTLVQRPNPGLQFYPSNGGVFGATYLYPTLVVRPQPWLDLKGALVVAQTTADFVDPYRFGVYGAVDNPRGGDPKRHDLGVELDAGAEVRMSLAYDMTLQLGLEAGILFPGHALDDRYGNALPRQGLVVGHLGLQY
ncbi:MAG: hypothetical protein ACOC1F_07015 [Myxococcota bacterium]